MSKKFLFSIIIPVYNVEKYIKDCLDSVLKAMDEDCEVIIINDGSPDNSEKIIKEFINNVPENLKDNFVYHYKDNKGLADTKNVGIEMARGEFISVVDSDDTITDDFYTIARKYTNDYDIIIYDLYIVFEKDKKMNYTARSYKDHLEDPLTSYLNGAMSGSSCNKIIRKKLYDGYKFPVGKQYEDTAVTPFILSEAKSIKYIPYPMYNYLQREKSIVATNTLMSAFYKIASNISVVLADKDIEKYKYVVNEFFVDRTLDMLSEDLKANKKEFLKNLEEFVKDNKKVIEFIVKDNMVYKYENHYSERQKSIVSEIYKELNEGNCKKVKQFLSRREKINKIRRFIKR